MVSLHLKKSKDKKILNYYLIGLSFIRDTKYFFEYFRLSLFEKLGRFNLG